MSVAIPRCVTFGIRACKRCGFVKLIANLAGFVSKMVGVAPSVIWELEIASGAACMASVRSACNITIKL